jgi:hypothetical protein
VCVAFEQASVYLCQPVCVCLESDNEQTGIRVYYEYYPGRWPNSVPMISALVVNIQLTPTWDFLFLRPTRVASEHGLALHGMAWHGGGEAWTRPGRGRETVGNNCLLFFVSLPCWYVRLGGLAGAEDRQQEGGAGNSWSARKGGLLTRKTPRGGTADLLYEVVLAREQERCRLSSSFPPSIRLMR